MEGNTAFPYLFFAKKYPKAFQKQVSSAPFLIVYNSHKPLVGLFICAEEHK